MQVKRCFPWYKFFVWLLSDATHKHSPEYWLTMWTKTPKAKKLELIQEFKNEVLSENVD